MATYHWVLAQVAAFWYGYPSEKLIVIGVTGTKGKSTTANLIAQLYEMTGHRVGLTSTATMKIGDQEWLNDFKMTMPGRFYLQRMLAKMVKAGCEVAIIETSSEGLAQHRHAGVHYDTAILTNLFPEHIESHGSFEAYRSAKQMLFRHLKEAPEKIIQGKAIAKTTVLNRDNPESQSFSTLKAGEEWWFGLHTGDVEASSAHDTIGSITGLSEGGIDLKLRGQTVHLSLLGKINAYNTLAAITTLLSRGVSFERIMEVAPRLQPVPGRQEFIEEGQPFRIIVDYAHEPEGLAELYALLAVVKHGRLIHVLGPTGGGRDSWRRPVMGELAALHADIVIGTTDDPYDDNPENLVNEMLAGAQKIQVGGKNVEIIAIVDRREAIREALEMARANDLVLITGKGAEQKMAIAHGRYVSWDDRQVVREELRLRKGM